jgi:hypothetical protein
VQQGQGDNIFVAQFDCSGKHLWSKRFGAPDYAYGNDKVAALATGADGSILLTGSFWAPLDFGTGPLTTGGFVAKLDADGNPVFAKGIGTGGGCALDPSGNAYVAATAVGPQDFGGGLIGTAGQTNAFFVKLDATGNHVFSKSFGEGGVNRVAVAPSGDVILAGEDSGSPLDFGGGPLPPAAFFMATLTANGSYVWAKTWGSPSASATPAGLAIGPAGEIVFVGSYSNKLGPLDFGGGPLPVTIGEGALVVKLTSAGVHVFSKGAGGGDPTSSAADATGVAVNASGEVYVSGYFTGTIDLGGGPVASAGSGDAFLAKLSPTGALTGLQLFGSPSLLQEQFATDVALDAAGTPYMAGTYTVSLDLGNGALPMEMGGQAAFLGRFAP